MKDKRNWQLARAGEAAACRYLQSRGLELRAANWRDGRRGELDLVMSAGNLYVFVEVKTRVRGAPGDAAEAVDARKLQQLRRLAAAWLAGQPARGRQTRIDLVTVTQLRPPAAVLHWHRGIA